MLGKGEGWIHLGERGEVGYGVTLHNFKKKVGNCGVTLNLYNFKCRISFFGFTIL